MLEPELKKLLVSIDTSLGYAAVSLMAIAAAIPLALIVLWLVK